MTLDGAAKVGLILLLLALVLYTGRAAIRLEQALPTRKEDYNTIRQHHTSEAVMLLWLFSIAMAVTLAAVIGVMLYKSKTDMPNKSKAEEPAGQVTNQEQQ